MVMENITIEKMEIKRFNALLMRTIVGMLFMGVLMWEILAERDFWERHGIYLHLQFCCMSL